jgi:hypothetical protein
MDLKEIVLDDVVQTATIHGCCEHSGENLCFITSREFFLNK